MPKLTPGRGGGVRLIPTGDGDYTSVPITLPDPLEGADPGERQYYIDHYGPLSMLEMCRRLRAAEWNEAVNKRRAEEAQEAARYAEERLAKAMALLQRNPPEGYTMPAAAEQLIEHAKAHGWRTKVVWTPPDYDGEPSLKVLMEHGGWRYELTWHSRGCQPGRVRLFSRLAWTPGRQVAHDAPSVKKIRAVIEANPAAEAHAG
ncbi:hypothetical protein [Streptomyces noursei]|uniref:hypothetical protein n=1 Tax=Streptomyces noursei TaxID=1971 RepID=UPI001673B25A|nr:hypothetical protein [Streptomyces noursei]MCZ1021444.1 hypothetical protein [Streptomyces noursei]GGX46504.1 hypothetical protein GCM10010341_80320 [Streptomyces noursei]